MDLCTNFFELPFEKHPEFLVKTKIHLFGERVVCIILHYFEKEHFPECELTCVTAVRCVSVASSKESEEGPVTYTAAGTASPAKLATLPSLFIHIAFFTFIFFNQVFSLIVFHMIVYIISKIYSIRT